MKYHTYSAPPRRPASLQGKGGDGGLRTAAPGLHTRFCPPHAPVNGDGGDDTDEEYERQGREGVGDLQRGRQGRARLLPPLR